MDTLCTSFSFKTESWQNITDCCEWDGVTCDTVSDYVIGLDLSCNNLKGELPPNSTIFQIRHLQQLNLAFNDFSWSSMHVGIGDLVNLTHLNLSNCYLSGNIPSTISHLSKLVSLDLSSSFEGLKLNPFTWDRLIHNATNLRELYLNGVDMFSIRESSMSMLKNLSSSLVSLNLAYTGLKGNLSSEILSLPNLQELDLNSNHQLIGQLPKSNWSTPLRAAPQQQPPHRDCCSVESISPNLKELHLSSTNINNFPKFLARLPNLQSLDLSHNNIHGNIPKWFQTKLTNSWKSFYYINLSFNKLQGDLPIPPYGTEAVLLSNNNFTGDISSAFCNATFLLILNLANNNLTGMIPKCMGTFSYLPVLDLQMNNLYGSIPNFSEENMFETIKLNGNQLEGPLPHSLTHCGKLKVLDLGDNIIEDVFPNWLQILPKLQVLSLRSNKLYGKITCSSTKHPFPMLRIFDVSNNNFSGPLPTQCIKNFQGMMNVNDSKIGLQYMDLAVFYNDFKYYNDSVVVIMKGFSMELTRILTTFTTIDLSNNMFEGEIPQVIGELNSLKGLNLSNNGITGNIPQSLSYLKKLEWLDLSRNQLSGEIPMALTNLNFLSFLNLSQNHLEGMVPKGQQFDTFGNESYVGNTMLCGFPLSKSCKKDKDWPPHSTSEDKEESGFGWKAVAIGNDIPTSKQSGSFGSDSYEGNANLCGFPFSKSCNNDEGQPLPSTSDNEGYACGTVFGMLLGYYVFLTGKPKWLLILVENYCEWDAVTCNTVSVHMIVLDLSYSYLRGSSVNPGIGDSVNLTHLNLSYTGITGNIPCIISHLSKLTSLDLDYRDLMRLDPFTWKNLILNAIKA
ncbi:receptor-like protein kinase [Trifolium pratense]|uniref:Receptor-like protein kinase n=1 Tax=Trifolium pratense TaxID=57577 RepID=A0A2K3PDP4_TRIPR|nr:receptor-like protein kinase [Trifolium pratense]